MNWFFFYMLAFVLWHVTFSLGQKKQEAAPAPPVKAAPMTPEQKSRDKAGTATIVTGVLLAVQFPPAVNLVAYLKWPMWLIFLPLVLGIALAIVGGLHMADPQKRFKWLRGKTTFRHYTPIQRGACYTALTLCALYFPYGAGGYERLIEAGRLTKPAHWAITAAVVFVVLGLDACVYFTRPGEKTRLDKAWLRKNESNLLWRLVLLAILGPVFVLDIYALPPYAPWIWGGCAVAALAGGILIQVRLSRRKRGNPDEP